MISIIKTAIITIVILIISGLLLERFKNVAPRILCNMENKYGVCSKPNIVLKSPENFKKLDSSEKNSILSLFNTDNTDKIKRSNK